MSKEKCTVRLYIDDEPEAIAELSTPVEFELNTLNLSDGEHTLKIVSTSLDGREGVKKVKFMVRNGPAIDFEGLKENQVVDGTIPLMINSYDKGGSEKFLIKGSETPKSIPTWMWVVLIAFVGWAAFYFIRYFTMANVLGS